MKTPGQLAYEQDCKAKAFYLLSNGRLVPRRTWDELDPIIKSSWEKNPTPRWVPEEQR